MNRTIAILVGLAAGLTHPAIAAAQSSAGLVDAVVEAYGGRAAIGAASAFVQTGEIAPALRGSGTPGRILRAFHRPDRLRVEITYPDREPEVRVLVGDRGWRAGQPVTGPLHQSMVLQAIRLDLPSFLLAFPDRLVQSSPVERGGRTYAVLVLDVGQGMTLTAEIEPDTGRVRRTTAHIPIEGMPQPLEFVSEYADYREVGGVMFAFREKTYAQGRHTADITLEEVRTFDVLPAEHFSPDRPASSL